MADPRDPYAPSPQAQADAALARLQAAEDSLEPVVREALGEWLTLVRSAVLADEGVLPDLDAYPDAAGWDAIVRAGIEGAVRAVYLAAWNNAMAGMVPGPDHDAVVADRRPAVEAFLRTVPSRLRTLPTEAFEVIRAELLDGLEDGDSIDRIRDRIGYVTDLDVPSRPHRKRLAVVDAQLDAALADPGTDPLELAGIRKRRSGILSDLRTADREWHYRARRIARTEATCAVNGGEYTAATARSAATGVPLRKQWLATGDSRTRRTHRKANGQVRGWSDPFTVGGFPMDHPGDPAAPGALTINCRCVLLTLYGDDEPLPLEPIGADDDEVDPELDELTACGGTVTLTRSRASSWSTRLQPRTDGRRPAIVAAAPAETAPVTAPPVEGEGAAGTLPTGWRGLLVPLGVESGDGRMVSVPPAYRARPLPLPFLGQEALSVMGHDGAVGVGRIDRVWVETSGGVSAVWGEGAFDLASDEGKAWARKLADGFAGGVSVDLGDVVVSERFVDAGSGEELDPERAIEILMTDPLGDSKVRYFSSADDWQLMGATLVSHPAFWQATVEAVFDYAGPTAAVEQWDTDRPAATGGEPLAAAEEYVPATGDKVRITGGENKGAAGVVASVDTDARTAAVDLDADPDADPDADEADDVPATDDGGQVTVSFDDLEPADPPEQDDAPAPPPGQNAAELDVIVAAARTQARRAGYAGLPRGPERPPASWFAPPSDVQSVEGPVALTVQDDGRVYGHLAAWNQCHTGGADACVTAPRSRTGYAWFHTGEVVCADGRRIACGVITVGGGHADVRSPMRGALEHYDNSGAAVAVVCASEDAHGIMLAGALLPEATDRQVAALMRSPLSGDWRTGGGTDLELIAALAVNAPGFPVPRPRAAMAAAGRQTALVAAGVTPPAWRSVERLRKPHAEQGGRGTGMSDTLARVVRRMRADQLAAGLAPAVADWSRTRAALGAMTGDERALGLAVARRAGYRPAEGEDA